MPTPLPQASLLGLPRELYTQITHHLGFPERPFLRLTCRQLYLCTSPPTHAELLHAELRPEDLRLKATKDILTRSSSFVCLNWRDRQKLKADTYAEIEARIELLKELSWSGSTGEIRFLVCRGCVSLRAIDKFTDEDALGWGAFMNQGREPRLRACVQCHLVGGSINRVSRFGKGFRFKVKQEAFVICRDCGVHSKASPGTGRCQQCWLRLPTVEKLTDECRQEMAEHREGRDQKMMKLREDPQQENPMSLWGTNRSRGLLKGHDYMKESNRWLVREQMERCLVRKAKREYWGMEDFVPDKDTHMKVKQEVMLYFGFCGDALLGDE